MAQPVVVPVTKPVTEAVTAPPATQPVVTTPPSVTPSKPQSYRSDTVYLTFEDIDDVYTPAILDTLSAYDAPAVFFVSGEQLSLYTDVVLRILAEGHAIGLHGMTSDELALWKIEDLIDNLDEENALLYAFVRRKTRLVRLPEGSQSGKLYLTEKQRDALAEQGYILWDWNISAMDHDSTYDADKVLAKVHEALLVSYYPVIRMHCTETASQILPILLQRLEDFDVAAQLITEATTPVVFPIN